MVSFVVFVLFVFQMNPSGNTFRSTQSMVVAATLDTPRVFAMSLPMNLLQNSRASFLQEAQLKAELLAKTPIFGESWSEVITPARAPALQKAEPHCRAGAPAGLGSQRVGRSQCPMSEFCKRLR